MIMPHMPVAAMQVRRRVTAITGITSNNMLTMIAMGIHDVSQDGVIHLTFTA
jgi:hypothetical protein